MRDLYRVIEHFGSQAALAEALDVTPPTVSEWMTGDRPIPPMRALQIEKLTGGKFKAERLNPKAQRMREILAA